MSHCRREEPHDFTNYPVVVGEFLPIRQFRSQMASLGTPTGG
ncbi:hypothetical protein SFIMM107S_06613 [Streptomyces griseus]